MPLTITRPLASLLAAFLTLTLFVQTVSMPLAADTLRGPAVFVAELA